MTRAYEEIVDFIAAGVTPVTIASFQLSPAAKARGSHLNALMEMGESSPEENSELQHLLAAEKLIGLAKVRVRVNKPN